MELGWKKYKLAIIYGLLFTLTILGLALMKDVILTPNIIFMVFSGYVAILGVVVLGRVVETKYITTSLNNLEEKDRLRNEVYASLINTKEK